MPKATHDREASPRHQTPVRPRLSAKMRSRLTNGSKVLAVDGRLAVARRYYDLVAAITSDQGGADELSETRLQLIRRFCGCSVLAETMEAQVAAGKPINIAEYAALISSLCRVSNRIGINRRVKNITPSLREYVDMQASEAAEANE
jgi:hypothetical protein